MSQPATMERLDLARVQRGALLIGAVAIVACVIGAFSSPAQFFRSYLVAYMLYLGIALGCLAILMMYHLTGGAWGFLVRRPLEAATRTLPLLALLMIPLGFGLGYLYVWSQPEAVAADANLQWKQPYLNVPFWCGRQIIYFVVWLAVAFFLNRWSRRQDETGDARYAWRMGFISGPGLVAYGIAIHFAAVDWIMSLQPAFRSSIFGLLLISGHAVSGLAVVLIVLAWLLTRPTFRAAVSVEALNDLGNLLFTFIIVWAYLAYFQFMLIWMANLPLEVSWYLDRSQGGWQWVAWAVFLFHFAVPFLLLLMRVVKRDPARLAGVAALLLFFHLVFLDWEILPAFRNTSLAEHWMDFLMPLGLGGIWLAYFLWQLDRRLLLPLHDPNEIHVRELHRHDLEAVARGTTMNHG